MKRLRRPKPRKPGRYVVLRDRAPEPATEPIRHYPRSDFGLGFQAAPVSPAPPRRFTGQDATSRYQIDLYDVPGPIPADQIDQRCRDALDCLRLKFKHLWREQMLFRIDEAEKARQRGEDLPEGERVITEYRQESAAHLLGRREPWQESRRAQMPGSWDRPDDPSGVRAAYDRAFGRPA